MTKFEVIMFLKQFRTLLDSGKSEAEALETISGLTGNARLRSALSKAIHSLRSGKTLAEALFPPEHPFPQGMARCLTSLPEGEQSLARTLESLEENYRIPARPGSGTLDAGWLLFMGVAFLAVVLIVMGLVVPTFSAMYSDFERHLPILTQLVINASNFTANWWFIVIIVVGVLYYFIYLKLIRPTRISIQVHQVFSLMAKKVEAGTEAARALAWAAGSVDDDVLRGKLNVVLDRMKNGERMADAFRQSGYFPSLVADVLALGEKRGAMKPAIGELVEYFGGRNRADWTGGGLLLEIGLMVLLLLLIGTLVVGMYLPIFSMATVVG